MKVAVGWGQPTLPSEDGVSLELGEFAPAAGSEVGGEMELADGDAEEAEGRESDSGGHFADLTIAAFVEGEFDPAGWDGLAVADGWIARGKIGMDAFGFGGERRFSFDDDTIA